MSQPERKAIIYSSPSRSIYVGRLERTLQRDNAVSTLLVSLEGEMELVDPLLERSHWSRSFLVPAGMSVAINTQGARVAMSFLDDLAGDLARLIPRMREELSYGREERLFAGIAHEAAIVREAEFLVRERPPTEDALRQFQDWIGSSAGQHSCDERVLKAAALIRARYAENLSVTEVAREVNLSVPRLIQLFKAVIGTPIRRYRLWWRILATAEKLTQGYSLTDAALASGFCDYAQFSRVYRELSGGSPAAAKNNTEIRILKQDVSLLDEISGLSKTSHESSVCLRNL